MKKVAVVGGGVSGLSAAWALRETHDVTLFEERDRAGGHAWTVDASVEGQTIPVDVGFIVCNPLNYPNFMAMLEHLGVETIQSDMSFALSDPDGYEWSSNTQGLFAKKRNILSPRYIKFLLTILKFNKRARQQLADDTVPDVSMDEYLRAEGYNQTFRDNYILPMGAAIWSTPERKMLDYPALSFLNFFNNHRLLESERPKWRTVAGGSRSYVARLVADLGPRLKTSVSVTSVRAKGEGASLWSNETSLGDFDDVILACHSDQAMAILSEDHEALRIPLQSIEYRPNQAYLHSDERLMPKRKAAWASWNVLKGKDDAEDVCLTYWMNKLQDLPTNQPMLVTLNPPEPPVPEKTQLSFSFSHPQFDLASAAAVRTLKANNGHKGVWLAGAWMGHGFHEDGLKSGLDVALSLGGRVPWKAANIDLVLSGTEEEAPEERKTVIAT